MLSAMSWQRGEVRISSLWIARCEIFNLQRAACSHPGEVLVEEVAFRILLEGNSGEGGRVFSPIFVLCNVRDDRDGGCSFINELVRERNAHRAGSDVAWSAASRSAFR